MCSTEHDLLPDNFPSFIVAPIILLRPSMNNINKNGERGNPFLKPMENLKKFEGEPMTKTTQFVEDTHTII